MSYFVHLYSDTPPGAIATFDGQPLPPGESPTEASQILWKKLEELGRPQDLPLYRILEHDENDQPILQQAVDATPEQVQAAQDDARLALQNADIAKAMNMMVLTRHLFAVSAHQMVNLLNDTVRGDGTPLAPLTFDVLAATANNSAADLPVEGPTVVQSLDAAFPLMQWLVARFSDVIKAEKARIESEAQAKDQKRRASLLRRDTTDELQKYLRRDQPLVFTGDRATILQRIDDTIDELLRVTYTPEELPHGRCGIVRMKFADPTRYPVPDMPYVQVGPSATWTSAGRTKKSFGAFVKDKLVPLSTFPVDVMVIDDLARFGNNILASGSANPSNIVITDAFKLAKGFADSIGAALIVGIPWVGADAPPLTDIRPVSNVIHTGVKANQLITE